MPTQDETPTLDADLEPDAEMDALKRDINLWRARLVLARNGVGDRTVKTCTDEMNRYLDKLSDAFLEAKLTH